MPTLKTCMAPLPSAAAGNDATVQVLLQAGACVNKTDSSFLTGGCQGQSSALMLAAGQGHAGVVQLLLQAGGRTQRTYMVTLRSCLQQSCWGGTAAAAGGG
jgi:hypothetical protein